MDEILTGVGAVIVGLLIIAAFVFVLALPTMWAVNYLFAPNLLVLIFGVTKFNFWKALVFNFFVGAPFLSRGSSKKD